VAASTEREQLLQGVRVSGKDRLFQQIQNHKRWYTLVIPALKRMRQEGWEFEISLAYQKK
jgi:hypothetical protein